MKHIDLNCDMGESFGTWRVGADAEVMPWVTSINVACGFHAGDPATMRETLALAAEHGVAVGAHVGLPDLAGFGRRVMAVSADEVYAMTVVQIGALEAMARTHAIRLSHLKPHGALYHMVEKEPELAQALVRAVTDVDSTLHVVGLAGGALLAAAGNAGLEVAHEAFADRRYRDDGRLAPRGEPGAVIEEVGDAVRQALDLAVHGKVGSISGMPVSVRADTLCVHGDRNDAAVFARSLHEALREAGIELRACAG